MNKKYFIPMFAILAIALVSAGVYIVNSFVITSDVYEPFEVSYAILGDAGNWNGEDTCSEYNGTWVEGTDVDVEGLYAGEQRKVCVKINNLGEGDVDYVIESKILNTNNATYEKCAEAFPEVQKTGTADASSETIDGQEVIVDDDAPIVNDCRIQISVGRGTPED